MVKDLSKIIGKEARLVTTEGNREQFLSVGVRITDARRNYGRIDALIEPLIGAGRAWVAFDRVQIQKETKG